MQTIVDLWYGNINPSERCGAEDPQIRQLIALMARHQQALRGKLPEEQIQIFQKYVDCSDEYLLRMLELAFCQGVCLGEKLVTEALSAGL